MNNGYEFQLERMRCAEFYAWRRTKRGRVLVSINTNHPFYEQMYAALPEQTDEERRSAVEMMLIALVLFVMLFFYCYSLINHSGHLASEMGRITSEADAYELSFILSNDLAVASDLFSPKKYLAAPRPQQIQQQPDSGGFARPIGTQKSKYLPLLHRKTDPPNSHLRTVIFRQSLHRDNWRI